MKFTESVNSTISKLLQQIIKAGANWLYRSVPAGDLFSRGFFELFFTSSEDRGIGTQLPRQTWCSSASRVWIGAHVKLWMFPGNLSHALCASCSLPVNTPPAAKGTGKPGSIS